MLANITRSLMGTLHSLPSNEKTPGFVPAFFWGGRGTELILSAPSDAGLFHFLIAAFGLGCSVNVFGLKTSISAASIECCNSVQNLSASLKPIWHILLGS